MEGRKRGREKDREEGRNGLFSRIRNSYYLMLQALSKAQVKIINYFGGTFPP